MMTDIKNHLLIKKNTFAIIGEDQLDSMLNGKAEVLIKWGIDPSSDTLHIGHMSCLVKLKQFLDSFSHVKVCIILGTATIYLHDPSASALRDVTNLTTATVMERTKVLYKRIKRFFAPYVGRVSFRYNHEWIMSELDMVKVMAIARKISLQDIASKFKKANITVSQGIYPILQAYDSYILQNDIELGGSDQLYNILLARENYRILQCKEQVVLLLNLLKNSLGEKMSKSLGNALSLSTPLAFWRKTLALEDGVFQSYLSYFDMAPETTKEEFAMFFINRIFDEDEQSELNSKRLLWKKDVNENDLIKVDVSINSPSINIVDVICAISTLTRSEVKRRIKAGAVKINNIVCSQYAYHVVGDIALSFGKMEKYLCHFLIK